MMFLGTIRRLARGSSGFPRSYGNGEAGGCKPCVCYVQRERLRLNTLLRFWAVLMPFASRPAG